MLNFVTNLIYFLLSSLSAIVFAVSAEMYLQMWRSALRWKWENLQTLSTCSLKDRVVDSHSRY